MIFEKNNQYYIKQGSLFYLADIILKKHTVVVMPASEYVAELEDVTEITYKELKEKFKGV